MSKLEDAIRDLTSRGEMVHLSLVPRGKNWEASFCPASVHGVAHAEHADPIEALITAMTDLKLRRRTTKVSKPTDPHEPETSGEVASEDDLASLGV